ncbi:hypothetical protein [Pseudomonas anguilliseptica]|uniref:hypothetical protein n=1 Tax=Pseudomonas anguilliseptica TaxID=53406 RepID=UPI003736BB29
MTIHVYVQNGSKEDLIAALEFELIRLLEPVFDKFKSLTGVRITEYDDVRLYPDHVKLLLDLLRKSAGQLLEVGEHKKFVLGLQGALTMNSCVMFVGE